MSNVDQKKDNIKNEGTALQRTLSGELSESQLHQAALMAMAQRDVATIAKIAVIAEEPNLVEKEMLIDVPFFMIGFRYSDGDHGEFVSVTAVLENGEIVVFNDGSSGICNDLRAKGVKCWVATDNDPPIYWAGGLRAQNYVHEQYGPCTTYYLSGRTPKQRRTLTLRDRKGMQQRVAAAAQAAHDDIAF